MKTKDQSVGTVIEPGISRIRKDGKPLFAEKIARVNAALKKAGVPKIPVKK